MTHNIFNFISSPTSVTDSKPHNDDKNLIKLIYNYLKNEESLDITRSLKLESATTLSDRAALPLDNISPSTDHSESTPFEPSNPGSPLSPPTPQASSIDFQTKFELFLRNAFSMTAPSEELLGILAEHGWKCDQEDLSSHSSLQTIITSPDSTDSSISGSMASAPGSTFFSRCRFNVESFDPSRLCHALAKKLMSLPQRPNFDINKDFLKLSPTSMFVPQMLLSYLTQLVKFNQETLPELSKQFFSVSSETISRLEQEIAQLELNHQQKYMVADSAAASQSCSPVGGSEHLPAFFSDSYQSSAREAVSTTATSKEETPTKFSLIDPKDLGQSLPPLPLFPTIFSFECACMIVDISGFTRLSGQFCAMGKAGIDKLQQATNGYLGELVDIIYQYGGDIIKFAGDAILCVFVSDNMRQSLNSQFDSLFEWSLLNQQLSVDNWYQQQLYFQFRALLDKKNQFKTGSKSKKFELKPPVLTPPRDNSCSKHDLCIRALNCALKLSKSHTATFTAHVGVTYGLCSFLMVGGGIQLPPYSAATAANGTSTMGSIGGLGSPQSGIFGNSHAYSLSPSSNNFISMNSQYMKMINEWLVSGKSRSNWTPSSNETLPLDPCDAKFFSSDRDEWEFLIDGECLGVLSKCLDDAPSMHVCVTQAFRASLLDPLTHDVCKLTVDAQLSPPECPLLPPGTKEVINYGELDGTFEFTSLSSGNFLVSNHDSVPAPLLFSSSDSLEETLELQSNALTTLSSPSCFGSVLDQNTRRQLNYLIDKFVPIPVSSALRSGGSLGLLAEIREVTVMFINLTSHTWKDDLAYHNFLHTKQVHNFDSYNTANLISHFPPYLQLTFSTLQSYIRHYGGFLRQLIVDDKGCVAIACWGVSSSSYLDNGNRATTAAIKILKHWNSVKNNYNAEIEDPSRYNPLEKLYLRPLDVSVGITTGSAYCGIVGKKGFRGEFAMVGSTVNLSARLMSSALKFSASYRKEHPPVPSVDKTGQPQLSLVPPASDTFPPLKFPLLIDAATQNSLTFQWSPYFQSLPPIHVKGKTEPVEVWAFRALNELDPLCTLTDEDLQNFIPDFLPPSVEESKIKDSIKVALYKVLEEIKPRPALSASYNSRSNKHDITKSSPTSFLFKSNHKKRTIHKIIIEGKMGTGKASVIRWFTNMALHLKPVRVLGIILESHGDHSYTKDSKLSKKEFLHNHFDDEYLLLKFIFFGLIDQTILAQKERLQAISSPNLSNKQTSLDEDRKNYLYDLLIRMSDVDDDIEKLALPIIATIFGVHLDINRLIKLRRSHPFKHSVIKEEEPSREDSITKTDGPGEAMAISQYDDYCQSCDTSVRSNSGISVASNLAPRMSKLPRWMIQHLLKEVMSFLVSEAPTVITIEHLQFADDASIRCIADIQNLIPHINSVFIFTMLDNEGVNEYNSIHDNGSRGVTDKLKSNILPSSLFSDTLDNTAQSDVSTSGLEEQQDVTEEPEFLNDFYDNHFETDGNQITLATIKRIKQSLCSNMSKNSQIKKIFGDDINTFDVKDNNTQILSLTNLNVIEINKMLNSMLASASFSYTYTSSPPNIFTGSTISQPTMIPIGLAEQVHHLTGGSVFWVNEILNFMKHTGIEEFMKLIDFSSNNSSPIKSTSTYKSVRPSFDTNLVHSSPESVSLTLDANSPVSPSSVPTQPADAHPLGMSTSTEIFDEKKSASQLHLLILTRYAKLNPNLQAVLKSAAIIGSRFTYGSLSSTCIPEQRSRLRAKLNSLVKDNWLRHKCKCIHQSGSSKLTSGTKVPTPTKTPNNYIQKYQSSYNYYNYVHHNNIQTEGWGIVNDHSMERSINVKNQSASAIISTSLASTSNTPMTCKGEAPCVYYFKHHILHDVILSLIPSSDRQKLHQQLSLYYQGLLLINYHWDDVRFEYNKEETGVPSQAKVDALFASGANTVTNTNINYNLASTALQTPQNIQLQRYFYLEVLHHCQAGGLGQMGFFFSVTKLHQLIYDLLLFISPNFTKPTKKPATISRANSSSSSSSDDSDSSSEYSDSESDEEVSMSHSIKIPGTEYAGMMNAVNISMLMMPLKLAINYSFKNLVVDILRYSRKSLMMMSSRADVMVLATVLERLDLGIQHWKSLMERQPSRPTQLVHTHSFGQGNHSNRIRTRPRFMSASSISKNSFYLPSSGSPHHSEKCNNCNSCTITTAIQQVAEIPEIESMKRNRKKRKNFLPILYGNNFFHRKVMPNVPSSASLNPVTPNSLSQKVSKKRRKKRRSRRNKSRNLFSGFFCCSNHKVAVHPVPQKSTLNAQSPFSPSISSSPSLYSYFNRSEDNSPVDNTTTNPNLGPEARPKKPTSVLSLLESLIEKSLKECDDFDEILTAHKEVSDDMVQMNHNLNIVIDYSNVVTLSDWQLLIINDPKFHFLNESLFKKKNTQSKNSSKNTSFISRSNFITKYISGYFTSSQSDWQDQDRTSIPKLNQSGSKHSLSFLQPSTANSNNNNIATNSIEFSKSMPNSPTTY